MKTRTTDKSKQGQPCSLPCNVRVSSLLEDPRTEQRLLIPDQCLDHIKVIHVHVICKTKQHAWLKKTQTNVSNTFLSAESLADEPKSANLMCPVRSTRTLSGLISLVKRQTQRKINNEINTIYWKLSVAMADSLKGHCHDIWQLYKKPASVFASVEFQN